MSFHKFRPAQEEANGVWMMVVFSVVWYTMLGKTILTNGFSPNLIVFLAAGILPLFTAVQGFRRALFYRRQRAEAIAYGKVCQGRIIDVIRKGEPYEGRRSGIRYLYYLNIETTDPDTGVPNQIESEGYQKPVHHYLASPYVQVYTDQTGWKHYIEDFQLKQHKNDPDVFAGPREFEASSAGPRIFQIIFVLILLWILFGQFFA